MTKTELNGFRRALETKQTELGHGSRNREALAIGSSPDALDQIPNASERDYAMGNLERNGNRLREVRSALRQMDAAHLGSASAATTTLISSVWPRFRGRPYVSRAQEAADRELVTPQRGSGTSLALAA
jgi:hypothetical protein